MNEQMCWLMQHKQVMIKYGIKIKNKMAGKKNNNKKIKNFKNSANSALFSAKERSFFNF